MTNEQKAAVQKAADNINETLSVYASYYGHIVAGMTYVIDSPGDFGLIPILDSMDHIEESDQNWSEVVNDLKSQLTEYREVLERVHKIVMNDLSEPIQEIIDVVEGVLYEGE